LVGYAVNYFKHLIKIYGKGRERKSEIRIFDDVDAKKVVVRNQKLYLNRAEGFIGTSLRKDEYLCDCSDIDDVIVFTKDGKMQVVRVDSKVFVGKDVIHAAVFKKNDTRTIYNMIYKDGKKGNYFIKRFAVKGITRDKVYEMTQGAPGSTVLYFTANPNGEAELVTILLRNTGNVKKLKWDLDFADLQIKGRGVRGNTVTKYNILRIELKEKGVSTLKPRKIWFDPTIKRLNTDERGELLGAFKGEDKILLINKDGDAKVVIPEMTLHFDENLICIEKWKPNKPITTVYFDREKQRYFIKRFLIESESKEDRFIKAGGEMIFLNTDWRPLIGVNFIKPRDKEPIASLEINVEEFIAVKGFKALGNQLSQQKIKNIELIEALPYDDDEKLTEEIEVNDQEELSADDDSQIKLNL
jgi:topoisomerase-4 subunit A